MVLFDALGSNAGSITFTGGEMEFIRARWQCGANLVQKFRLKGPCSRCRIDNKYIFHVWIHGNTS